MGNPFNNNFQIYFSLFDPNFSGLRNREIRWIKESKLYRFLDISKKPKWYGCARESGAILDKQPKVWYSR